MAEQKSAGDAADWMRAAVIAFICCFIGHRLNVGKWQFSDKDWGLMNLIGFAIIGFFPTGLGFGAGYSIWTNWFAICPHGVIRGRQSSRCSQCVSDKKVEAIRAEQVRIKNEAEKKQQDRKKFIADAAAKLRFQEMERLQDILLPTLNELLELSPQRFEDEIACLFGRLGYEVKQTPYSNDHGRDAIMMKDGRKTLLECKRYGKDGLSTRPHLQKFHSAMTTDKAYKGFFVTTGIFTRDAIEFAKEVNIEAVDGKTLIKFMLESKPDASSRDDYAAFCPECMDRINHRLRAPAPVICTNGHTVLPNIKLDELLGIYDVQRQPRCPECRANLRLIDGRNGRFWGCTRFPVCRYTKSWKADGLNEATTNAEKKKTTEATTIEEGQEQKLLESEQRPGAANKLAEQYLDKGIDYCYGRDANDDGGAVDQDYDEAATWFRKAAEMGNNTAQYELALLYCQGDGVPKNYVQAHKWFDISWKTLNVGETFTVPDPAADEQRDFVEQFMTPEQIAEAQKLAREWTPK